VERGDELGPGCHCEERSDEAIQLDCDEWPASAAAVGFASLAMTNQEVHQQRSEKSSRRFERSPGSGYLTGFFAPLRMTEDFEEGP
jgi:hypothetical protein